MMRTLKLALLAAPFLASPTDARAELVYDFVISQGPNAGAIGATLVVMSPPASYNSAWSTSSVEDVSALMFLGASGHAGPVQIGSLSLIGNGPELNGGFINAAFVDGLLIRGDQSETLPDTIAFLAGAHVVDIMVGRWVIDPSSIPAPVPEPSTLVLSGLGFAGLAGVIWRRRRAA